MNAGPSIGLIRPRLAVLAMILLWASCSAAAQEPVVPIVPLPKIVERRAGFCEIPSSPIEVRLAGRVHRAVDLAVERCRTSFREAASRANRGLKPRQLTLNLGVIGQDRDFDAAVASLHITPDPGWGDEGYRLLIGPTDIWVAAVHDRGIFYALQSLTQLLRSSRDGRLPAVSISDWPDMAFRGVQDDISRGPVPTLEYLREQIRRSAELKLNAFTCYTEHVVRTDRHALFAPADGSISIEEWKTLDAYAQDLFVELIGNFQSIGHFENILRHPSYEHLGEGGRMLSPALGESYRLLSEIYGEMAPAFSSHRFIVNADEVFDLGRGASKRLVDSLGVGRVYARHLAWIRDELARHGKVTLMWADMALRHREVLNLLPKDMVMMPWDYGAKAPFDEMIPPLQRAGFAVIVAPGIVNSRRLFPQLDVARENIRSTLSSARRHGVDAMLLTTWDDGGGAFFSNDWYGVAYAADRAWHADDRIDESFDRRFCAALYGDTTGAIIEAMHSLLSIGDLEPTSDMTDDVLSEMSLPERGRRLGLAIGEWEGVLEAADSAAASLDRAVVTEHGRDLEVLRLITHMYRLCGEWRLRLVDAAERYREACRSQTRDRRAAAARLQEALGLLDGLTHRIKEVEARYERAWYRENQVHFLDRHTDRFSRLGGQIADARSRIGTASTAFADGRFVPPPSDVRLDVVPVGGGYFRSWMICGPFRTGAEGPEEDFLVSMGGEQRARPTVWVEVSAADGTRRSWKKIRSPHHAEVDLAAFLSPNEMVVAYAYCRVESDADRPVRATFGSNDGIDVLLNGERVVQQRAKRGLIPDEHEAWLPLRKGQNHLLLKVDQNKGSWGFSFRLPDVSVRGLEYKYRIVRDDGPR